MSEKNYVVSIEYPLGGCSTLAVFENLKDALIFLEGIMNNIENDFQRFSIRQVYVNDNDSVHRYDITEESERS